LWRCVLLGLSLSFDVLLPSLFLPLSLHDALPILFYSFTVRFITPESKLFKVAVVVIGLLGFLASRVGFTTLVNEVYSAMGYLGFALIIAAVIAWVRKSSMVK